MELAPRPRRLTQEERSAETRARLLDATIQSLVEVGYARTTTTRVCEIAGLSRGAQIHHFGTRADLLTSALEHLARRRIDEFRAKVESVRSNGAEPRGAADPRGAGLDLLWESYSGPLFIAALELWVAARTDPDLYERLLPLEREIGRQIQEPWLGLADDASEPSPAARDLTQLSHHMMRGMVLQRILNPDDRQRRRQFDLWKRLSGAANGAPGNASHEEEKP
ncbi:MAG: TetR/AcrR family transcriptional regulator [Deltaproteobacteria bacterium]|nr:TetR/AcrR family transcriptional regulator [Deltaproteobacteria bacterium]MBW2415722.1 TetR/AcrR family transcriptional regulator [Deltaproteobacteria bacterium]